MAAVLGALTTSPDRERTECERPATGEARVDVRVAQSHDSPSLVVDVVVRVPAHDPLVAAWRRTGPATPYLLECVLGHEVRRNAVRHSVETAAGQATLFTAIELLGRHLPWDLGPLTFDAAVEGIVVRASDDCDAAEPNKHRGCGAGLLQEVAVVTTDVPVVHAAPAPDSESTEAGDGTTVHTLRWTADGAGLERVVIDLGAGRNLGAWLPTVLRGRVGNAQDDWALSYDLNAVADRLDVLLILLVVALVVRRMRDKASAGWALLFGFAMVLIPNSVTLELGPIYLGSLRLHAVVATMSAILFVVLTREPPWRVVLGLPALMVVPLVLPRDTTAHRMASYAVILVLVVTGVGYVARALWSMQALVPRLWRLRTRVLGLPLVTVGIATVAYLFAYTAVEIPEAREIAFFYTASILHYFLLEWALPAAVMVLVATTRGEGRTRAPEAALPAACLLFAVAAGPTGVRVLDTFTMPVQLVLAALLLTVVRRRRPPTDPRQARPELLAAACRLEAAQRAVDDLDRRVDGAAAQPAEAERARRGVMTLERATAVGDPGAALLAWGPARGWWHNGRRAAILGVVLAVLPVGYFVGAGLAVLPQNVRFGSGPLHLLMSACAEMVRWTGTAFAFGALYPVLPGRIGPTKALSLGGLWFAAAGAVEVVRQWTHFATGRNWVYPGLVLVVFLLVLSVLYDVRTLARAEGTWRRLQDLYRIRRRSDLLAYLVPFGVAVVGVAQQLVAGNGFEVVKQVLSALAPTPMPSP